jgi:hypothetical protein
MIDLQMSLDELLALPVSVDLVTAGRAFGLGRTKAFELAQTGEFPCPVIRVGLRYRVPRSGLLEALGFDPAGTSAAADAEPTPAAVVASRSAAAITAGLPVRRTSPPILAATPHDLDLVVGRSNNNNSMEETK